MFRCQHNKLISLWRKKRHFRTLQGLEIVLVHLSEPGAELLLVNVAAAAVVTHSRAHSVVDSFIGG
jgi:hypothetical protein